jgi:endonuclease YncB( thermonuclease family)
MNIIRYIKRKMYNNTEIIPSELYNATLQNTPRYTIKGQVFAKCVKVYDGDTITVATRFNNIEPIQLYSVRLLGVDTAELKSKNLDEKKFAKYTRDFVAGIILNNIVKLDISKLEKYGRLLGEVYILDGDYAGKSLSSILLERKMGYVYAGGTKQDFTEWNVGHINH